MSNSNISIKEYLKSLGVAKGKHILMHCSWRKISSAFPSLTPQQFICELKNIIAENGSIIFPTFTYCFKKKDFSNEIFDTINSVSKVGCLSEVFRTSDGVIRTKSPTHSFALWGEFRKCSEYSISPKSPLGSKSVMELLVNTENSFILMIGVHFEAFTLGHYLEVKSNVPWKDYSPWEYLGVEKVGVSIDGEEELIEIPGCAKSFTSFEKHLISLNKIQYNNYNGLDSCLLPVDEIMEEGLSYFSKKYNKLLCEKNQCFACDSRRSKYPGWL